MDDGDGDGKVRATKKLYTISTPAHLEFPFNPQKVIYYERKLVTIYIAEEKKMEWETGSNVVISCVQEAENYARLLVLPAVFVCNSFRVRCLRFTEMFAIFAV